MPPGDKGVSQFVRRVSPEEEQQHRERLLEVSTQDLKRVAERQVPVYTLGALGS